MVRMGKLSTCVLFLAGAKAFNGPGRPVQPATNAPVTDSPIITDSPATDAPATNAPATEAAPTIVTAAEGAAEVIVEEYTKAVMHDFRSKDECWDGLAAVSSDCWQGADGIFYRYGCSGDDGKVYTDICESSSCDPEGCLGEWTWHQDEMSSTCYYDGTTVYQFQCTNLGLDEAYEPANDSGRIEGSSAMTCQALGWDATTSAGASPFVCAASKIGGECHDDKTHEEASDACASVGGRLCTAAELTADEAKGSGCKADSKRVWSSDACEGGFIHQAGASKNLNTMPAACGDSSATASVRCCADTVNSNIGVSSGLPSGYQLATSYEYAKEDGVCGGNPSSSYSCWSDGEGNTHRFACATGQDSVWSQKCDEGCASCEGDWSEMADQVGRCYSDGAGGLYSYDC